MFQLFAEVCFLRLDFESFNILGTVDSLEQDTMPNSVTCRDTFTVTGINTGQTVPTICGQNAGQHSNAKEFNHPERNIYSLFHLLLVYIDIGQSSGDSATLNFNPTSDSDTTRTWEIKVTQIACGNPSA